MTMCNCEGIPHLMKLDMEKVRKAIPHTKGKHPPYQGKLLCNGHCKWDKCNAEMMCTACEYVECWGCAEDFQYDMEEKLHPEYDGYAYNYCRNCGYHDKMKEISGKEEYFKIINPWMVN